MKNIFTEAFKMFDRSIKLKKSFIKALYHFFFENGWNLISSHHKSDLNILLLLHHALAQRREEEMY